MQHVIPIIGIVRNEVFQDGVGGIHKWVMSTRTFPLRLLFHIIIICCIYVRMYVCMYVWKCVSKNLKL
jgi:hypothetical protein